MPAEVLTGSQSGKLSVHCSVVSMLDPVDDNVMSALQYALRYLEMERMVLYGRYDCGSVQAALSLSTLLLVQGSSVLARHIGRLCHTLHHEIAQTADGRGVAAPPGASTGASADAERSCHVLDALAEANVHTRFTRLLESGLVQTMLVNGRLPSLYGCVCDPASGHLTTPIEHLSPQEHVP